MESFRLALGVAIVAAVPVAAGLMAGAFNKLQAKWTGGSEPSLLQPFINFRQLLGQELKSPGDSRAITNLMQLAFSVLAVSMLVLQKNIVAALFFQAIAGLMAIMASTSNSDCDGETTVDFKMKAFLTYQPVLLAVGAGIGLAAGSFLLDVGQAASRPLIVELPFLWGALVYVIYASGKLDLDGIFAGPMLAVAKLAASFRQAALLLLAGIFFTHSLLGACMVAILLACSLAATDCFLLRLPWRLPMTWGWGYVYFACTVNLSWLYIKYLL
jgi:hypothetical protein